MVFKGDTFGGHHVFKPDGLDAQEKVQSPHDTVYSRIDCIVIDIGSSHHQEATQSR